MLVKSWTHKNLRCAVTRNEAMYHFCGYVGVDESHPLFNKPYDKHTSVLNQLLINKMFDKEWFDTRRMSVLLFCWNGREAAPMYLFEVHGGLSFSDGGKSSGYPTESDLWWFGYHCAHAGDSIEVQNLDYCIKECNSLAEQLSAITA